MITVKYRCVCMAEGTKARVKVPERGDGDMTYYIKEVVMPLVSAHHRRRSRFCEAEKLPELYIPYEESGQ